MRETEKILIQFSYYTRIFGALIEMVSVTLIYTVSI